VFRLFSGSAAIRLSGAAAQLLLTLVIARLCGAAVAGIFFFGYSIAVILATLARLGCELSGSRAVASLFQSGHVRELKRAVDSRLAIVVVMSIVCSALLLALTGVIADKTYGAPVEAVLWCSALTIPPLAVAGLLSELLKGAQHAWLALTIQNFALPSCAVALILALWMTTTPSAQQIAVVVMVAAWLAAAAALIAWSLVFNRRFGRRSGLPKPKMSEVAQTLRETPSLIIVSTTSVVMQWVGATILGFFATASEVAGYSVAMRISIAVSIIHSAASSVVGPQMAIAFANSDTSRLRRICHQTSLMISGVTWPGLLLMLALGPICMSVFGGEYEKYAYVLRTLLLGQLVAAVIGHSGTVLVMSGRYASARWSSVIAAICLAVFSLAAVPILGPAGAAIAMASSVVVGHVAGLLLARRDLGIWTVPTSREDVRAAIRGANPMEMVGGSVR
jgi:O-antigen/teichoic acid export membrane protein